MTDQRTIRALVGLDAALVLLLAVLLTMFLTGGGEHAAAPPASPAGTATAGTPSAPAVSPSGPRAFKLPSGNIACAVSPDGATCTIASFSYPPPAVAGCAGPTGHVIVLSPDGIQFDCEEGPAPTVAGAETTTLEYGSSTKAGDYTCTSGTDGVTCTDGAGKGFRLARAAWTELP